ncbi:alpha/beta fold hydrolase [Salinactinospora qingdaonensis]
MHSLRRPGGQLAYDGYGDLESTKPLVVCVPGMGDHRTTYRFLGPALAEAGYRVAAMDLRGHGDSDPTFDSYDDPAMGSDLIALVEELGGGPAVLVGNSMGAAAAAWAAAQRPELVSGLVLLGPFLRSAQSGPVTRLLMRLAFLRPWGPAVVGSYFAKLHAGRTPKDHAEHLATVRAVLRQRDHYRAIVRTLGTSHDPVEARLGEIEAPALVLMGELDPDWPDPAAEAAWIAERLDARVVMVAESGHYPQSQRSDLVVPAILEFSRELGRD